MLYKTRHVKERIFIFYMYFFTSAALLATAVNTLIGLGFLFNIKWIISAAVFFSLSVLAKKRFHIELTHRIGVYSIAFIILPMCWITGSGILSPSLMYTAVIIILVNTVLSGRERIVLNVLVLILTLVLIWLFYNKPHLYQFIPPRLQFIDWMAHTPIMISFVAILLITFEKAYEEERVENKKRESELEKLATTDHLTGLSNRNDMDQKFSLIHSIWERGIGEYSVILLDIDYFKAYNDHHGHLEGDSCLKEFGRIIKAQLRRGTDWAFRYGGEEFLLILGLTDAQGAKDIGEKIQKAVYKTNIPHDKSKVSYRITASIGIATIREDDDSFNDLIKRADDALYKAKQSGRNQISVC